MKRTRLPIHPYQRLSFFGVPALQALALSALGLLLLVNGTTDYWYLTPLALAFLIAWGLLAGHQKDRAALPVLTAYLTRRCDRPRRPY